jgi:flavodoxin short chain
MKAMIIFGSTTGNTEAMSEIVSKSLTENGMEVTVQNVTNASVDDLKGENDLVLLGCPAYGEEEVELQEDFDEFYEQMGDVDLSGKKFAVFAPGDSSYEHFCGSVDFLEEKIKALGGEIVDNGLKIDGDPDDEEDEILNWSAGLVKVL